MIQFIYYIVTLSVFLLNLGLQEMRIPMNESITIAEGMLQFTKEEVGVKLKT